MGIPTNWRDHLDAFFGNNMLVLGVIGSVVALVMLGSILGRSDDHSDRHRPH